MLRPFLRAWSRVVIVAAVAATAGAQSPPYSPQAVSTALHWRYVGPVGNRVSSVAGVPGDPNTYYAGAASGGIWKTTDGGVHWAPIFDTQAVHSVGALAVARTAPNIVWAGTGEPWIRSHISVGDGIYKSTDAGATWTNVGLPNSGRIGRIVIHPSNPDIVFVAAQGYSYGPQKDRGLYRTTDGGKTWQQVLFVDENTGAIDVQMDPTNPNKLLAAMWSLEIRTYGRKSGGPGGGIFMSTDGGTTWKKLQGNGLPKYDVGKIGISDTILKKPGRLDPDEVRQMQAHTVIGARLFADSPTQFDETARDVVLNHHERWDGSGYPDGLSGTDIPLLARIFSVADVFDALISARPYKLAWSVQAAADELREQAGKKLDPVVVQAFLTVLQDDGLLGG